MSAAAAAGGGGDGECDPGANVINSDPSSTNRSDGAACGDTSGRVDLMSIVSLSFLDPSFVLNNRWTVVSMSHIVMSHAAQTAAYREKKLEFEQRGSSCDDRIFFRLYNSRTALERAVNRGTHAVSAADQYSLGDRSRGFTLYGHADALLDIAEIHHLKHCWLLLIKVMLGRATCVPVDDVTSRQPLLHHDCHVFTHPPHSPEQTFFDSVYKSQLYVYEVDHTAATGFSRQPGQCLPYAFVELKRTRRSPSPVIDVPAVVNSVPLGDSVPSCDARRPVHDNQNALKTSEATGSTGVSGVHTFVVTEHQSENLTSSITASDFHHVIHSSSAKKNSQHLSQNETACTAVCDVTMCSRDHSIPSSSVAAAAAELSAGGDSQPLQPDTVAAAAAAATSRLLRYFELADHLLRDLVLQTSRVVISLTATVHDFPDLHEHEQLIFFKNFCAATRQLNDELCSRLRPYSNLKSFATDLVDGRFVIDVALFDGDWVENQTALLEDLSVQLQTSFSAGGPWCDADGSGTSTSSTTTADLTEFLVRTSKMLLGWTDSCLQSIMSIIPRRYIEKILPEVDDQPRRLSDDCWTGIADDETSSGTVSNQPREFVCSCAAQPTSDDACVSTLSLAEMHTDCRSDVHCSSVDTGVVDSPFNSIGTSGSGRVGEEGRSNAISAIGTCSLSTTASHGDTKNIDLLLFSGLKAEQPDSGLELSPLPRGETNHPQNDHSRSGSRISFDKKDPDLCTGVTSAAGYGNSDVDGKSFARGSGYGSLASTQSVAVFDESFQSKLSMDVDCKKNFFGDDDLSLIKVVPAVREKSVSANCCCKQCLYRTFQTASRSTTANHDPCFQFSSACAHQQYSMSLIPAAGADWTAPRCPTSGWSGTCPVTIDYKCDTKYQPVDDGEKCLDVKPGDALLSGGSSRPVQLSVSRLIVIDADDILVDNSSSSSNNNNNKYDEQKPILIDSADDSICISSSSSNIAFSAPPEDKPPLPSGTEPVISPNFSDMDVADSCSMQRVASDDPVVYCDCEADAESSARCPSISDCRRVSTIDVDVAPPDVSNDDEAEQPETPSDRKLTSVQLDARGDDESCSSDGENVGPTTRPTERQSPEQSDELGPATSKRTRRGNILPSTMEKELRRNETPTEDAATGASFSSRRGGDSGVWCRCDVVLSKNVSDATVKRDKMSASSVPNVHRSPRNAKKKLLILTEAEKRVSSSDVDRLDAASAAGNQRTKHHQNTSDDETSKKSCFTVEQKRCQSPLKFKKKNREKSLSATKSTTSGRGFRIHGATSTIANTIRSPSSDVEECNYAAAEPFSDVEPDDIDGGRRTGDGFSTVISAGACSSISGKKLLLSVSGEETKSTVGLGTKLKRRSPVVNRAIYSNQSPHRISGVKGSLSNDVNDWMDFPDAGNGGGSGSGTKESRSRSGRSSESELPAYSNWEDICSETETSIRSVGCVDFERKQQQQSSSSVQLGFSSRISTVPRRRNLDDVTSVCCTDFTGGDGDVTQRLKQSPSTSHSTRTKTEITANLRFTNSAASSRKNSPSSTPTIVDRLKNFRLVSNSVDSLKQQLKSCSEIQRPSKVRQPIVRYPALQTAARCPAVHTHHAPADPPVRAADRSSAGVCPAVCPVPGCGKPSDPTRIKKHVAKRSSSSPPPRSDDGRHELGKSPDFHGRLAPVRLPSQQNPSDSRKRKSSSSSSRDASPALPPPKSARGNRNECLVSSHADDSTLENVSKQSSISRCRPANSSSSFSNAPAPSDNSERERQTFVKRPRPGKIQDLERLVIDVEKPAAFARKDKPDRSEDFDVCRRSRQTSSERSSQGVHSDQTPHPVHERNLQLVDDVISSESDVIMVDDRLPDVVDVPPELHASHSHSYSSRSSNSFSTFQDDSSRVEARLIRAHDSNLSKSTPYVAVQKLTLSHCDIITSSSSAAAAAAAVGFSSPVEVTTHSRHRSASSFRGSSSSPFNELSSVSPTPFHSFQKDSRSRNKLPRRHQVASCSNSSEREECSNSSRDILSSGRRVNDDCLKECAMEKEPSFSSSKERHGMSPEPRHKQSSNIKSADRGLRKERTAVQEASSLPDDVTQGCSSSSRCDTRSSSSKVQVVVKTVHEESTVVTDLTTGKRTSTKKYTCEIKTIGGGGKGGGAVGKSRAGGVLEEKCSRSSGRSSVRDTTASRSSQSSTGSLRKENEEKRV